MMIPEGPLRMALAQGVICHLFVELAWAVTQLLAFSAFSLPSFVFLEFRCGHSVLLPCAAARADPQEIHVHTQAPCLEQDTGRLSLSCICNEQCQTSCLEKPCGVQEDYRCPVLLLVFYQ